MPTLFRSRLSALWVVAALAVGCKDNAPDPNVLSIAAGGTQNKIAGTASDEMRVLVTNTKGEPVAGATVTWTATSGALTATTTTSDGQGLASNTLSSVGDVLGLVTVTAKTAGGSEASFSITVVAEPPGRIERFSSDPGNVSAGASDSIRVRVLDYLDVPRAGVTVKFTVTAGNGVVEPASVVTNAQGVAATRWTRGGAGMNTVSVSAAGYNNSPVSFNVNAVAQVASIRYEPRVMVVDTGTATVNTSAVVRDGSGAVMTSAKVTYLSRSTSVATVDSTGRITGVQPGQTIVVASVTSASNQVLRDSAVAVVAVPGGPVLLTDLPRFDLKTDTTITVVIRADMRTSSEKLGSGRVTVTWDPGVLTYQSHAEAGSNVGATVNANNAASGTIVLAFASSAGFGGNVELRRITFKAASTTKSGTLSVAANEVYTAGTYMNLLPFATSVATPLFTR
jgi:hypothetical protein